MLLRLLKFTFVSRLLVYKRKMCYICKNIGYARKIAQFDAKRRSDLEPTCGIARYSAVGHIPYPIGTKQAELRLRAEDTAPLPQHKSRLAAARPRSDVPRELHGIRKLDNNVTAGSGATIRRRKCDVANRYAVNNRHRCRTSIYIGRVGTIDCCRTRNGKTNHSPVRRSYLRELHPVMTIAHA